MAHAYSGPLSVYLNLPICLVAFVVLLISLRGISLGKSDDASWRKLARKFDFGGLWVPWLFRN